MKYREILTIACTSLLSLGIPAQTKGPKPYRQWLARANVLYNAEEPTVATDSTALALFLRVSEAARGTVDEAIAIESLIKAGNIHQGYQRFVKANALYHEALALNQKQPDKAPAQYEAALYLGSSMYFNNILDSAKWYFEQASAIESAYPGRDKLPERDRLYNSLGALYFEGANYRQARNYFQKALEFSNPESTDYTEMYNGIQSNIANCLMKLSRYDSALVVLRALRPSVYQQNLIRQNTAHCLFEVGRPDEALALYETIPLDETYASVVALTNIGRIHMQKKDWRKAETVFDSAIARNKRFSKTNRNKEEALSYVYRATLADLQGLTDEAISWANEALRELYYDFTPRKATDLPGNTSATVSPVTAFQALNAKAGFLLQKYHSNPQPPLLEAAVRTYRKAIETAAYIRAHFDNDEATLFFNQYNRQVFQEALDAAYIAYSQNEAAIDDFLFILENYKGNSLLNQMQRLSIQEDFQVPDSLLNRERQLRQLVGLYTTRLNQTGDETQEKALQKRLLDIEVELSRLQQSFTAAQRNAAFPSRTAIPAPTIAKLRSSLSSSEAMLSYFLGDGYAYCLAVSSRSASIHKLPLGASFDTAFNQFTQALYEPKEGIRYQGNGPAAALYKTLVAPGAWQIDHASNWIVIPDGKLYLLPFDALMTDPGSREYLLHRKTISYHYAATLLLAHRSLDERKNNGKAYLAFAPFIPEEKHSFAREIAYLPRSGDEIEGESGGIYRGSAATREAFLSAVPHYRVIHLATHASTGGDSSGNWIQFYPRSTDMHRGRLSIHEVYNLDLDNAQLVILSACETAGGAEAGGEGLISLSRAFLYAGANGIISTLWKSEDQVTAWLMKRFRHYHREGVAPEEALTLAKRDLLRDKQVDARFQSPAYWANFIYTGEAGAGRQEPAYLLLALAGLTVGSIALGRYLVQRNRSRLAGKS